MRWENLILREKHKVRKVRKSHKIRRTRSLGVGNPSASCDSFSTINRTWTGSMLTSAGLRSLNAAPRYPEKVSVYLPKGMRMAIERAASRENITAPELMRRALAATAGEPEQSAAANDSFQQVQP
jgi:hypothetical protein